MTTTNAPPAAGMQIGVTGVMLPELDFAEQMALCRELGVTHYSLRPRPIPEDQIGKPWGNWGNHKWDLTPERLLKQAPHIRKQMSDYGVTPFGTVPAIMVTEPDDAMKLHFDGAAAAGAGRVRVQPYAYPQDRPFDYAELLKRTVDRYGQLVEIARRAGNVKMVIETHSCSFAASPGVARNIVQHFDPKDVGVIFDLANYAIEGNLRPSLAVAVLRDWIDHCHVGGVRRTPGKYDAFGFREPASQMCPLTESDLHLPAYFAALRDADVRVPLVMENYTENITGAERLRESAAALKRLM
ncbi:MAG: sugar phosphate isomerase/epimerase family protein [Tepidisphaeraceae bacterium]